MRQELLWVPSGEGGDMPRGGFRLPYAGPMPTTLWSLTSHRDPAAPPALPFRPVHQINAFVEDAVHDWKYDTTANLLRYYSRVSVGGHWLLLEFEARVARGGAGRSVRAQERPKGTGRAPRRPTDAKGPSVRRKAR